MVTELTADNLQTLLASDKPIVIDFWASWCGPCRMVAPIVEELAVAYADEVTVAKCNVDDEQDLAIEYGIRSIPTLLFIKQGIIVDKQIGAAPKNILEQKIKNLLQ